MPQMNKELMLEELTETCRQLGYSIRYEKGDFSGGHCILKEQRLLVVNKRISIERKISTIARALADLGVEAIFVKPVIRELIDAEVEKADR